MRLMMNEANDDGSRTHIRREPTATAPHASPITDSATRKARVAPALFGVRPEQPIAFLWSERRRPNGPLSGGSHARELHVACG